MAIAISYKERSFPLDNLQIPYIRGDLEIENAIGGSPVKGFIHLTKQINRLHSHFLPKAIEENSADFGSSLIFTALNVALFIAAFWLESVFFLFTAIAVSGIRYTIASEEFTQPRDQKDFIELKRQAPTGPWFCPNRETFIGGFLFRSGIWPAVFGLIAPVAEAYTRPQRVEQTLSECIEQFEEQLPAVCRFYKKNVQKIAENLKEKSQWAKDVLAGKKGWLDPHPMNIGSFEVTAGAEKDLKTWIKFLRKFNPSIPLIQV